MSKTDRKQEITEVIISSKHPEGRHE